MSTEIGRVEAIFRYPVKSMAGERVDVAQLGWHGMEGDRRIAVRLSRPAPFQEDGWPGRMLVFGESSDAPRISVTLRDARCSMVNLDPDSGRASPEVLKAVVRTNENNAGVYGTVVRTGRVATGQDVHVTLPDGS